MPLGRAVRYGGPVQDVVAEAPILKEWSDPGTPPVKGGMD